MKLHYKGTYDLNPDSLPNGEHKPNAVKFKEAEDSRQLGRIGAVGSIIVMVLFTIPIYMRCREYYHELQVGLGLMLPILALFPHELLHAICFKEDVYLYTNLKQGMLFVVGPESMSKGHFIFMSLLPNVILGFIPYIIGMIFPEYIFFAVFGMMNLGMGVGDYYNVFNAATQMPKGAKEYLYKFHSYWYMPE